MGEKITHQHNEIRLLIFGGSVFVDREPNPNEYDDKCYLLTIPADSDKFTLKLLPGAKLR